MGETRRFTVHGIGKWETNEAIINLVQQFLILNGEYNQSPKLILCADDDSKSENICDALEKFKISKRHRIAALVGQYGIKTAMDIPKNTVFGQYIGAELSYNAFAKVFEGTADEHEHNIYSMDLVIDEAELDKIFSRKQKRQRDVKQNMFVVDPLIDERRNNLFPFVNDCRFDIDDKEMSEADEQYFNAEFVGMSVNGWPQTYLIATKDMKKGEELNAYYGEVFGLAIRNKMEDEKEKKRRRFRIDKEMIHELKDELQSTFRLCQHI